MNYVLVRYYDHYAILNDDADFIVGRVYPLDGQDFRYLPISHQIGAMVTSASFDHSPMPFPHSPRTTNETRHSGSVKR